MMIYFNKRYKTIAFITLLLCSSSSVLACVGAGDCEGGQICVRAEGSVSVDGICVTPTNEYGVQDYNAQSNNTQTQNVTGCQFNTDCSQGYHCMKQGLDIYGLCLR